MKLCASSVATFYQVSRLPCLLITQPTLSRRQARWSEYLQRFHFSWVHRSGRHNVADPLSRNPSFWALNTLLAVTTRSAAHEAAPELPSSSSSLPASAPALGHNPGNTSPALSGRPVRACRCTAAQQPSAQAHAAAPSSPSSTPASELRGGRTPATGANTTPVGASRGSAAQQPSADAHAPAEPSSPTSSSSSDPIADPVDLIQEITEAYVADLFFEDDANTAGMSYAEGPWWRDGRIVVPDSKDTKLLILKAMHDHPLAGHFSVAKTLKAIDQRFFWRRAAQEVSDYIKHCPSCQANKSKPSKPSGLLQPLDVPLAPWHTVTTDYITGLPLTAKRHNAIAVFVDKLTKYVYAVPCSNTSDATDWTRMYVEHLVQHQGLSEVIISDRGPQFISTFNKALAARLGIKWNFVIPKLIARLRESTESLRMSCVTLYPQTCLIGICGYAWLSSQITMHGMRPLNKLLSFSILAGLRVLLWTSCFLRGGDVDNPASCKFAGKFAAVGCLCKKAHHCCAAEAKALLRRQAHSCCLCSQ